jgi:hypothetical protein
VKSVEGANLKRRKKTAGLLEKAIEKLESNRAKVTISAVAKLANVSSALIHNTYPDLAEKIRSISGKSTRAQRDAKQAALKKAREENRKLRAENAVLKADLAKQASVNYKLLTEMAVLKGMVSGKVITLLRQPATESSPGR